MHNADGAAAGRKRRRGQGRNRGEKEWIKLKR